MEEGKDMETYQEFLNRINSFEKKEVFYGYDYFTGNPSIAEKVDSENQFKEFYGDTIVFQLDDEFKKKLEEYVEELYKEVPECFCEKLVSNTYHMTLHDLSNSPVFDTAIVEGLQNEWKVLKEARNINVQSIKMKSKYIFNMVGTSLVLGLYPADEKEYEKLMELYCLFDKIKTLNYPLTPHITLAYYNVHGFSAESARKLEQIVLKMNDLELETELKIENLYYQRFLSMNHYVDILNLGEIKNL